jgi:hypothetical protein
VIGVTAESVFEEAVLGSAPALSRAVAAWRKIEEFTWNASDSHLCVDKRPSCLESATCDFVPFVRWGDVTAC